MTNNKKTTETTKSSKINGYAKQILSKNTKLEKQFRMQTIENLMQIVPQRTQNTAHAHIYMERL